MQREHHISSNPLLCLLVSLKVQENKHTLPDCHFNTPSRPIRQLRSLLHWPKPYSALYNDLCLPSGFFFCCRYICFGAVLFSEWEGWNFLDSSYFCFISLSTIGFGDIVPGERVIKNQEIDMSFIFCSMYLMLGMALIAMCFNLMQEEVVHKMRSCMQTFKFMFTCKRRQKSTVQEETSGIR